LHVFHNGDDGKIDYAQAQSGIDILNTDFNGLNSDWNTIDPEFDSIKATLDIQFCLATIDPDGNPTTGINYYDDSLAMLNIPNLFQYAWDNYKYLNIYLPKYVYGGPSLFTAYAYYPSTSGSNNNAGGIFYSSYRWGYGTHSELTQGQEWASVNTHETGHWLNLRHTFENGCNSPGDYIDDTPPTLGGTIEVTGCDNNDYSCNVHTNGENYMDYNHDCKKMFTRQQVDWMIAALYLPSRITLWSDSNLIATGCVPPPQNVPETEESNTIHIYPNPTTGIFTIEGATGIMQVYDITGRLVYSQAVENNKQLITINPLEKGLYVLQIGTRIGKIVIE